MDRLERLVNLVAALLDTPRPLTREEIRQRIDGYSDDADAFRRNFERDKDLLRQMGMPLATEPLDPNHPDEIGYRIPREQYELPDPGLDERRAGRLAAGVRRGPARRGLGTGTPVGEPCGSWAAPRPATPVRGTRPGEVPGGPRAGRLAGRRSRWRPPSRRSAERRRLRFSYQGEARLVDPWRLSYRRGQWYLAGFDHGRGEERLFRLDRMEGPLVGRGRPGRLRPAAGASGGPAAPVAARRRR